MRTIETQKAVRVAAAIAVLLLIGVGPLVGQEGGHGRAIDAIVEEITREQGVSTLDAVDPDLVPPALLEELGDSVMAEMIDDEARHEWMDDMMGGVGSSELAARHRLTGYDYIESDGDLDEVAWGPGVTGAGMMGDWGWNDRWAGWGRGSMMGWWSPWSWIIGILLVVGIVVAVALLVRRRGGGSDYSRGDSLDILKRRYATGEISKEEFDRMRDDLR